MVRYHTPWRRGVLWSASIVGSILLIYGTYEWGRFDGGYDVFAMIQERRNKAAEIEVLKQENAELRAQVANAETSRRVERQSYADVEKSLGDLQGQVQKQREELAFYHGIVAPDDSAAGLKIQRLDVLADIGERRYKLRLVLMQSMSRDNMITGSVKIELEGTRNKQSVRLALSEVGGQTRASGEVPFAFRYFQNIETDITLPPDFVPAAVDVELKSSRQKPVQRSFTWSVRAAG